MDPPSCVAGNGGTYGDGDTGRCGSSSGSRHWKGAAWLSTAATAGTTILLLAPLLLLALPPHSDLPSGTTTTTAAAAAVAAGAEAPHWRRRLSERSLLDINQHELVELHGGDGEGRPSAARRLMLADDDGHVNVFLYICASNTSQSDDVARLIRSAIEMCERGAHVSVFVATSVEWDAAAQGHYPGRSFCFRLWRELDVTFSVRTHAYNPERTATCSPPLADLALPAAGGNDYMLVVDTATDLVTPQVRAVLHTRNALGVGSDLTPGLVPYELHAAGELFQHRLADPCFPARVGNRRGQLYLLDSTHRHGLQGLLLDVGLLQRLTKAGEELHGKDQERHPLTIDYSALLRGVAAVKAVALDVLLPSLMHHQVQAQAHARQQPAAGAAAGSNGGVDVGKGGAAAGANATEMPLRETESLSECQLTVLLDALGYSMMQLQTGVVLRQVEGQEQLSGCVRDGQVATVNAHGGPCQGVSGAKAKRAADPQPPEEPRGGPPVV